MLSRPDARTPAAKDEPGAWVIRRLLPAAAVALVVLGLLRWEGERQGLYGTEVGLVLMTLAAVGVIAALLFCFARRLDQEETTRREVAEELRRTSRYFELSRDLVCTAGFDGVLEQLNAAWTQTLGWSADELRSRPLVDFVHSDDREQTAAQIARLEQGGVVDFVSRFATTDGGWRWIDWSAMSVVEEGLIYASARDVTHRIAAEAALKGSERQTRQILETAQEAFISMDADGLITDWNPQAQISFGWSREEVLGRELAETVIPLEYRDAHRRGLERFLTTGEARVQGKRLELTAIHRDGHEFAIEMTISPLVTDDGVSFNAFLRDISERQNAQAELALARDKALEASRMKSMFVANVSHEIRTPMNGVIGMAELLLDTSLDAGQREYAETISSSGEALLEIIDDILDFSKIEAGKLELDPTDFDPRDLIERACGMLVPRAHKKGVELVVAVDPAVPALVHGDGARLRQVIVNLVSNSIKFTGEGEVVLRASAAPAGDGAVLMRIEVSDTGIGIEPSALERLFNPFSQADGSTTRKYGGTGLGLSISRRLIELMGGTLGADSEPGRGSTFWVQLPLGLVEGSRSLPAHEHELRGLRVLVVDDNAASRDVLRKRLASWRMDCDVADGAAGAMELLEAAARAGAPYAVALLDLDMPDADGRELAQTIRATPALRAMALMLLTSGRRPAVLGDAAVDAWLSKPVRQSRLYEEIRAVLAGEDPARQRSQPPAPFDVGTVTVGERPYVLVVEDTSVNQVVAVHMLNRCGFEAQVAESGVVALQALAERPFVAVLMDCQMPDLDGYETTRELRRREQGGPRLPIIAMTANSMQGERERCLAAGMDDYLTKPLRSYALKEALTRWVREQPADAGTPAATAAQPAHGDDSQLLDEAVVGELDMLESGLLTSLLTMYFSEAAGRVSELTDAIERNEPLVVRQAAHRLKGASSTLGAVGVSKIAAALEAMAKADDLATATELVHTLCSRLEDTREAYGSRVAHPLATLEQIGSS